MKLKTHSGAKKRFQVLAGGKIKRKRKNHRHGLSNKTRKHKRQMKGNFYVHDANSDLVRKMLALQ